MVKIPWMGKIREISEEMKIQMSNPMQDPINNDSLISFSLSPRQMADFLKAVNELNEKFTSIGKENREIRKENREIRNENREIRNENREILKDLQVIKSRDMLKGIKSQKPKVYFEQNKPRLEFSFSENRIDASLLTSFIEDGNKLAHYYTVKNVYACLMDFETSAAIAEDLQNRLSTSFDIKSLSRSEFISVVAGVPKSLIQYALGKFMWFQFEMSNNGLFLDSFHTTDSLHRKIHSVIETYFGIRFRAKSTLLSKLVKDHPVYQGSQSWPTLNIRDEEQTVDSVIFCTFQNLNTNRENPKEASETVTELKHFIKGLSKPIKSHTSSPQISVFRNSPSPTPSSQTPSVQTLSSKPIGSYSTVAQKGVILVPSSFHSFNTRPFFMHSRGWRLPLVNIYGLRFISMLRMGRKL